MSPYEQIRQLYRDQPEANPFEWYVEQHLLRGYVFSAPDYFVMGLPVCRADMLDGYSYLSLPRGKPDTWFLSALAGNMAKVWEHEPYPLAHVGYERDGPEGKRLMIFKRERIRERTA